MNNEIFNEKSNENNEKSNERSNEKESLTIDELRMCKGFEESTEGQLQEEVELINVLSRVLYNYLLKIT